MFTRGDQNKKVLSLLSKMYCHYYPCGDIWEYQAHTHINTHSGEKYNKDMFLTGFLIFIHVILLSYSSAWIKMLHYKYLLTPERDQTHSVDQQEAFDLILFLGIL